MKKLKRLIASVLMISTLTVGTGAAALADNSTEVSPSSISTNKLDPGGGGH